MLRTIQTGTHISIQGEFVRNYPDGNVMVRVGQAFYVGKPVVSSLRRGGEDDTHMAAVGA